MAMRSVFVMVVFLFIFVVKGFQRDNERHGLDFMTEIAGTMCQEGFERFSDIVVEAVAGCATELFSIPSYNCFKVCVYKKTGVEISTNETVKIDLERINTVLKQVFNIHTEVGRRGYTKVATNAHECAKNFTSNPNNTFPMEYNNATFCEIPDMFYACTTGILTVCPIGLSLGTISTITPGESPGYVTTIVPGKSPATVTTITPGKSPATVTTITPGKSPATVTTITPGKSPTTVTTITPGESQLQ